MIRIAAVFVAVFAVMQDPSPLSSMAARVDDKDPQGSARAIVWLAAQPSDRRAEIEKAAATWPAFYRDAWSSDVKSRDAFKAVEKPELRIALRGDNLPLAELVSDLTRRVGLQFNLGSEQEGVGKAKVSIESADVTPMEALADLCRAAELTPQDRSGTSVIALMKFGKKEVDPWAAGHFGVFFQHMGIRERVDFSGPTERIARMDFFVLWDKEIRVATIRPDIRLLEAVADTGEKLKLSIRESASSVRESEEYHGYVNRNRNRTLRLPVLVPSFKTTKIARLRFVASALVPRRVREYSIDSPADPEKCGAGDEEFKVTVTHTQGLPTWRRTVVHILPLKMKAEELLELPLIFSLSYARAGEGQTYFKPKLASGAVEYEVSWYPVEHFDPNHGAYGTVVESVKVMIPLDMEERPIYVDFKDIPIR